MQSLLAVNDTILFTTSALHIMQGLISNPDNYALNNTFISYPGYSVS